MKKNKIIILASIIVGVLVVTLGLTYASLSFNETRGNSQLVLGDIWMHYNETNQLVLSDAMPMDINDYVTTYKVNPVMASQELIENELSRCVDYLTYYLPYLDSHLAGYGGFETYCKGIGTFKRDTFQEDLNDNFYDDWQLEQMLDLNIIVQEDDGGYIVNPVMASQEVVGNELSRCMNYFYGMPDEGSTTESFCRGTGTLNGMTLQQLWDNAYQQEDFMEQGGNLLVNKNIIIPQIENLPYFEFRLDGKNTYNEKDIWYEIVLNHGDNHATRTERIRDDLLKFRLVEVVDGVEITLFNNKKYKDLSNRRIHVDTIPANTNEEINRTYRLYMWISEDTVIGNVDEDYTLDEWNDVFASIKVNVAGDFNEKELVYDETDASCFETKDIKQYTYNSNITEEEANLCANYLTDRLGTWNLYEGETYESFCQGTGTFKGLNFQDVIDREHEFRQENYDYFEENNIVTSEILGIQIQGYDTTCEKDVVIPKMINGYNVKFIGNYAFDNLGLSSVVFPNTIERIDFETFTNNNISRVEIPSSITYLSCYAFDNGVSIYKDSGLTCIDDYVS